MSRKSSDTKTSATFPASLPLLKPDIRLWGEITTDTFGIFLDQLNKAMLKDGPILMEVTTEGGAADIACRIAQDIRLCREKSSHDMYFIGKTCVYSAGVVIMSAFEKEKRFLTRETRIMIHERRMDKQVKFSGALTSCIHSARELISQFETGQEIEREGFKALIKSSTLKLDEVVARAMSNWYITADECLKYGLIQGIV